MLLPAGHDPPAGPRGSAKHGRPGRLRPALIGRRLAELGAGVPPIPYRKLSPAPLASAIRQLTGDPGIAARAKQLSAVLSAENGPSVAARVVLTALAANGVLGTIGASADTGTSALQWVTDAFTVR